MNDIIQVLPDRVANQIAAGEVVQRPASLVKELLENSIDAGATDISLIVRDAGRTLVQVVDNGKGMSNTDARLCFERHATSKIRNAEELFHICTKGFRGEALASIAAVAHVELRTKEHSEDLGTLVTIEGSEVTAQEPVQAPGGTSISVKNLFYNVPARRNFLKSDKVELKHIIDEFERVVLAHPDIAFSLHHNDHELFRLRRDGLRRRIVDVFGPRFNERLVPVSEETDLVTVGGFVGKPEHAKKTRGEQFFFVNSRFIKNSYLHHAVSRAFEGLIPEGHHPSYFLYLEVDPQTIDVNIHPTKTEIKFEDEKAIYAILRSAIRKSLGQYNISPSLDFERETSFDDIPLNPDGPIRVPTIEVDPDYNPFDADTGSSGGGGGDASGRRPKTHQNQFDWTSVYREPEEVESTPNLPMEEERSVLAYQLQGKYILTHIKSGFMIIDQHRAHQRILFEQFQKSLSRQNTATRQLLFQQTLELGAGDLSLIEEQQEALQQLGFDIERFGHQAIVVRGIPPGVRETGVLGLIEKMLDDLKNHRNELGGDNLDNLARFMARNLAVRSGAKLEKEEMHQLVDELFACEQPFVAPNGKSVLITLSLDELDKRFQ
ncbi:MAG: DNA mismatch repair endonuclease MutL [Flavobacteriales bacterium]|nr:DNA mismatch repair endonuclease MutL [Flavobacteriales bacterium]